MPTIASQHSVSGDQRSAIRMAFRWRADAGTLLDVYLVGTDNRRVEPTPELWGMQKGETTKCTFSRLSEIEL